MKDQAIDSGRMHLEYGLGADLSLNCFSLNPSISEAGLANMLSSKDGSTDKLDLEALAKDMSVTAQLGSLAELRIDVSDEVYEVPEPFKPFRGILEGYLKVLGQFSGPVMVVRSMEDANLEVCKGEWFDFKATDLCAVPAEVLQKAYGQLEKAYKYCKTISGLLSNGNLSLEEINAGMNLVSKVQKSYPVGKTISELLPKYDLDISQMARYLGFAFIMLPSNGQEISLVERAGGLGIAEACMAFSGKTPAFHNDFLSGNFDFKEYFESNVNKAMEKEYKLNPNEFTIGKCYLIDDIRLIPFVAIEIKTDLSTEDLAKRCYGDKDVNKQHSVLYSVNPNAIDSLINRFPIYYSTAYVLNQFHKEK
jgi:hypothetical protein